MQHSKPKNPFEDTWKISCKNGSGFLKINGNDSVLVEVNSNQIYINAHGIKKTKGNITFYDIYFVETDDLGRGSMQLNWDKFSKEKMICKLILNNEGKMELEWFGFHNINTKKYEWAKKADFMLMDTLNYPKCLEKCI